MPGIARTACGRCPRGSEILEFPSLRRDALTGQKYTFQWEGKDNAGKLVKEGTYTVQVEAPAREHGGYNLVRREINWQRLPRRFNCRPAVSWEPYRSTITRWAR